MTFQKVVHVDYTSNVYISLLFSVQSFILMLRRDFGIGLDGSPTAKENDKSQGKEKPAIPISEAEKEESTLSITVVGASGDLAKKKIFPALFALFYEDWLPEVLFSFRY